MTEKPCPTQTGLPQLIRVSLGTAIALGLIEAKLDAKPTTAYLMTYRTTKCTANCGFCPQARGSQSNVEYLSRVSWPSFETPQVLAALAERADEAKIRRVCIQSLNYPEVFGHLEALVREIKKQSTLEVSVSCQPRTKENIQRLAAAGVDRLGIALDAATQTLFNKVKGKDVGSLYSWESQFTQLDEALAVFGHGNVSTHVIVGLGESEKEALEIIQRCVDMGVLPALFAFTPVRGTALEAKSPPKLESYRRIQLARYLIVHHQTTVQNMQFDSEGKVTDFGVQKQILDSTIAGGLPFRTSGCPDCNRPYYNEKPRGPMYNYPKQPSQQEIEKIKEELT